MSLIAPTGASRAEPYWAGRVWMVFAFVAATGATRANDYRVSVGMGPGKGRFYPIHVIAIDGAVAGAEGQVNFDLKRAA